MDAARLGAPVGLFTGRKLTALTEDAPACRALLDKAGVRYTALPPRSDGAQCGYDDAVRFTAGGARRIALAPAGLGTSCPVAAALAVWEWNIVQPQAEAILGSRVVAIRHFGSYSCRRLYGRDQGNWSEHARANAVDIAGFQLADGRSISVVKDWNGDAPAARFLHAVRDGRATCSRPPCHRTIMPRTATICISTRRRAAHGAGAPVADDAPFERMISWRATGRPRPSPPNAGRSSAGGSTSPMRSPPPR